MYLFACVPICIFPLLPTHQMIIIPKILGMLKEIPKILEMLKEIVSILVTIPKILEMLKEFPKILELGDNS